MQLPDRFPTKQGLKQIYLLLENVAALSPRPISNKTRIETNYSQQKQLRKTYSQTDFQQNKDWNKYFYVFWHKLKTLPDRFPTKQGLKRFKATKYLRNKGISQTDFQQNKDWN